MTSQEPDFLASKNVRIAILVLATAWLALEIKRQSTWGIGLAVIMFAFAAYEVFFSGRDTPEK